MSDHAIGDSLARPAAASQRLRTSAAFAFLAMAAVACVVAGSLLIARARSQTAQITQRAQSQASSLSFKFDQEIAAVRYLLKGLSRSPALLSGDLKGLYDQMKATDLPDGTWLLFQDLEKQLVNTSLPFGSDLPRHSYFKNSKELLERIRNRGWTVSGRMIGPATGAVVIALNLRVDDAAGHMTHFLTTILSGDRLRSILNDQEIPANWMKGLYDRQLQPVVTAIGQRNGADISAPPGLAARIGNLPANSPREGSYNDQNADGLPVLVAYRHSDATNWTTVVEVPLASVVEPLNSALWQIGWLALFLLLMGGPATLFIARRMEPPLNALEGMVTSSVKQINELSAQLLALQEEERQRIARELHDSTAQHLVAASLGLMNLRNGSSNNEDNNELIEQIETMIDLALKEIRTFTYLLHPPDLEKDGLQATLRDFIEGFASRTGLDARIRIPEEVDALSADIQWSILRVVQEALGNTHRHAAASRIFVNIRVGANHLVMQIGDDGRGIRAVGADTTKIRLGVGVPGMRARLKQFGGDLRIRSGPGGTTVVAIVPLSRISRASLQAERLADVLLPVAAKADRGGLR